MGGFRLFTLADIPVWISPWHVLLLVYFGWGNGKLGVLYAGAAAISLLVHEFGHALVAKAFRLGPSILMTGFGGLCAHRPAQRNRDDALVTAAGPAAGFVFCAVSYVVLRYVPLTPPLTSFVRILVWVNLVWSTINLLPLWPLDGGKLYRLGLLKLFKPVRAERITHITALVLLAGVAYFIGRGSSFNLLLLAMLAMENIQAMQQGTPAPVRRENKLAPELLARAEHALREGNDEECTRICHQIRAESNVAAPVLARTWALLGVTSTRKGEYEEALSYLRRAPDSPEVVEATAQCFYQLEMYEALEALTQTKAFARLPSDTRELIMQALNETKHATPA